jgi:hypothetical protein
LKATKVRRINQRLIPLPVNTVHHLSLDEGNRPHQDTHRNPTLHKGNSNSQVSMDHHRISHHQVANLQWVDKVILCSLGGMLRIHNNSKDKDSHLVLFKPSMADQMEDIHLNRVVSVDIHLGNHREVTILVKVDRHLKVLPLANIRNSNSKDLHRDKEGQIKSLIHGRILD